MKPRLKVDKWYHVAMGWALVMLGTAMFSYAALGMYWSIH